MSPALTDRFFSTKPPIWGGIELIALAMILVLGYIRLFLFSEDACQVPGVMHETHNYQMVQEKVCVRRGEDEEGEGDSVTRQMWTMGK